MQLDTRNNWPTSVVEVAENNFGYLKDRERPPQASRHGLRMPTCLEPEEPI